MLIDHRLNIRTVISCLTSVNTNIDWSLAIIMDMYKKFKVHDISKGRSEFGEYFTLFPYLKKDESRFQQYMRMKIKTFYYILEKVENFLGKQWCNLHPQPIGPEQALVVTIKFLVTGASFKHLAFTFRMGVSTVKGIVERTMNCLWEQLHPIHMPVPTKDDFTNIARKFYSRWGLPHCLGAIDVRHIRLKKPSKSGSKYFNYKKFFSIAFQAVVGPDGKYICIDVGGYGRQHDSTTFFSSKFYAALKKNLIQLPNDSLLPDSSAVLPFFFVGDGAYPLMRHFLKPYLGKKLTKSQEACNKRLSRARIVSECTFGRTCQKFQIFYTLIQCSPKVTEIICKSSSVLMNVIIDLEGEQDYSYRSRRDCNAFHKISKNHEQNNNDHFPVGNGSQVREKLRNFISNNPLFK